MPDTHIPRRDDSLFRDKPEMEILFKGFYQLLDVLAEFDLCEQSRDSLKETISAYEKKTGIKQQDIRGKE